MKTLQNQRNNSKGNLLWLFPYFVVLIGLFFSYICLSEFYNVKFAGQESAYAFGDTNENQWAYLSASNYIKVNLIYGLLFSIATVITFWATLKKNKKLTIIGAFLTLLLILVDQITMRI